MAELTASMRGKASAIAFEAKAKMKEKLDRIVEKDAAEFEALEL